MTAKTLVGAGRRRPTYAALEREIRTLRKDIEEGSFALRSLRLDLAGAQADAKKWRERAELQTEQIKFWIDRLTVALQDWQKKGPKT